MSLDFELFIASCELFFCKVIMIFEKEKTTTTRNMAAAGKKIQAKQNTIIMHPSIYDTKISYKIIRISIINRHISAVVRDYRSFLERSATCLPLLDDERNMNNCWQSEKMDLCLPRLRRGAFMWIMHQAEPHKNTSQKNTFPLKKNK